MLYYTLKSFSFYFVLCTLINYCVRFPWGKKVPDPRGLIYSLTVALSAMTAVKFRFNFVCMTKTCGVHERMCLVYQCHYGHINSLDMAACQACFFLSTKLLYKLTTSLHAL